jgi:hypothetical protein
MSNGSLYMLIFNKRQRIAFIVMAVVVGIIGGAMFAFFPNYFCYYDKLGVFNELNKSNRLNRKFAVVLIVIPLFVIVDYFCPMDADYDYNASFKKFFFSTILPILLSIVFGILSCKASEFLTVQLMNVILK